MAKTGQGAGADDDSDDATPEPAMRRARARGSQEVTRQRVDYVLQLYVNGYSGQRLLRKVAAAHAKEAGARQQHREADERDARGETGPEPPPLLWGMDEQPPAHRTVDRWLQKAKGELETRGSTVQRLGDRLLGLQLARLDKAWQVAMRNKRPASMVRVVEVTNDMFAFEGAIRPTLSALSASGERTGDEKQEPPPDARLTEESAVTVLAELLTKAKARRQQALAHPEVANG